MALKKKTHLAVSKSLLPRNTLHSSPKTRFSNQRLPTKQHKAPAKRSSIPFTEDISLSCSSNYTMPSSAENSKAAHDAWIKMMGAWSLSSDSTPATSPIESSGAVDNNLIKTMQGMSLTSDSTHVMPSIESSSAVDITSPSTSKTASFMGIPPELRLQILSHALRGAAGSSGTISINPRVTVTGDEYGYERAGQTKWQARHGLLQTCHILREEALEVLFRENTFYAKMSQTGQAAHWFEKQRFSNWLESMGGDEEIQRVRKVTFGLQWSTHEKALLGWKEKYWRGDVCVSIFKGEATVGGSPPVAECPPAPIKHVDALIKKMMVGEGLGYAGWMAVWDKIEKLMMSGWGSREWLVEHPQHAVFIRCCSFHVQEELNRRRVASTTHDL